MHVDVTITPAKDCAVGTEVLWPLHGENFIWRIYDVHADGLACRSDRSKDILIIPRPDFPVPVVTRKTQHNPFQNQYGSSTTGTFGGAFGSGWSSFGGTHA